MTAFWSAYVTVLSLGTLVALTWLLFATRKGQRDDTTEETVGHVYDGIEEYDNPLPRWWFMLFIGTLVFSVGYLILYPGLGNWKGIMPGYEDGWTQVKEWEREMQRADAQYGPIFAHYAAMPIEDVARDERALRMGNRLFASNCALCHGSDAKGSPGFPNLADDNWRWGGDPQSIKLSILNGRHGMMPPWGHMLGEQGVKDVAGYVLIELGKRTLADAEGIDLENGKKMFSTTCIACHGPSGTGLPMLGAPDLTKPSGFIYGSSLAQVQQSIEKGRQGVMPGQQAFLGNDKVHLLAAYVYSLSHPPQADAQAD